MPCLSCALCLSLSVPPLVLPYSVLYALVRRRCAMRRNRTESVAGSSKDEDDKDDENDG